MSGEMVKQMMCVVPTRWNGGCYLACFICCIGESSLTMLSTMGLCILVYMISHYMIPCR